jgi:hypothetical protein
MMLPAPAAVPPIVLPEEFCMTTPANVFPNRRAGLVGADLVALDQVAGRAGV